MDNGSGRLRGVYAQSNAAVIPIWEQILSPFRDLGVVAMLPGNTGGTDHLSFDAAGVPGFQYVQDALEHARAQVRDVLQHPLAAAERLPDQLGAIGRRVVVAGRVLLELRRGEQKVADRIG